MKYERKAQAQIHWSNEVDPNAGRPMAKARYRGGINAPNNPINRKGGRPTPVVLCDPCHTE